MVINAAIGHSFSLSSFCSGKDIAQKIAAFAGTRIGKFICFSGLGMASGIVCGGLAYTIVKLIKGSVEIDPLEKEIKKQPLPKSIFEVCLFAPIVEEYLFRGVLQNMLKKGVSYIYARVGFIASNAVNATRITSVFYSSVLFGLVHFSNAIGYKCDFSLFFQQVIAATFMGLILGYAKELSGGLYIPILIHLGCNAMGLLAVYFSS